MSPPPAVRLLEGAVAVVRLAPGAELPGWAATTSGPVWTVTRTARETSICCAQDVVPPDAVALRDLRALVLAEDPPPDAVGVLAALTAALAQAGVWVLAICTHDTDHLLVRAAELERALAALG